MRTSLSEPVSNEIISRHLGKSFVKRKLKLAKKVLHKTEFFSEASHFSSHAEKSLSPL